MERTIKLNKDDFIRLCCGGSLHFNEYDVYHISTLTYHSRIAVLLDGRTSEKSFVKLELE